MRLLASFLLSCFFFAASASKVDSLQQVYTTTNDEAVKLQAMIDLAWALRNTDAEKAIDYAEQAAVLAQKLDDKAAQASALVRKAIVLRKQGLLSEAQALIEEAVPLKSAAGDSLGLALTLSNLSQVLSLQGAYDHAIAQSFASIKVLESLGHTAYQANGYNNLAGIYRNLGQHQKAIEAYNHCLELAVELGDSNSMSRTWYNLGVSYVDLNQLPQAHTYFGKALQYAQVQGDVVAKARLHNSIGSMHYQQNQWDSALYYFSTAKALYADLEFGPELAMVYNNIASVYSETQQWDNALGMYHQAAHLAQKLGNPADLQQVYQNLSATYEKLHQTDSALFYFQQHTTIKDSLFNEEKNRQIIEVQEKYESAKKDQEIAQQASDLDRQNLWLVLIGLLTLGAVMFGINYYQKLQTHKKLAAKELELNEKNMLELVRNQELKAAHAYLDGETAERERLAGELHDRLGSQLATVKLHYDHVVSQSNDPDQRVLLEKANALLGQTCVEVRELAHNLASGLLQKSGLITALESLCTAISDSGQLSMNLDAFELEERLPPHLELNLLRSVQELVSNTIKHAQATEFTVQLVRYDDHLNMVVADNGKGFNAQEAHIKDGMGLRSIASRIEDIGGSFSIDSQPGHGTTAIIEVPLTSNSKTEA